MTICLPTVENAKAGRAWLCESAFPCWADAGFSRKTGGFYDKLTFEGVPLGSPTRIRVQTRQIYAFVQAGRIGWNGPWAERVASASHFIERHFKRADGFYRSNVSDADNAPLDLYDQAFVLLALAQMYGVTRERLYLDEAVRLLACLVRYCRAGSGGYAANMADQLRWANPNMHLFEAFLAWAKVSGDERFAEAARGLAALACAHLFDEQTSSIAEVFDHAWQVPEDHPAGKRVVEPGHQFEWAFLLYWAELLLDVRTQRWANRLVSNGLRLTDEKRPGVSVFQADAISGQVVDGRARLWAQTERLRTLGLAVADTHYWTMQPMQKFVGCGVTVDAFLNVPLPGLWYEWQDANGEFVQGDVPATSLYHLVSALLSLPISGSDTVDFPY